MEIDVLTTSKGTLHIIIYGSMYKSLFSKELAVNGPELSELSR